MKRLVYLDALRGFAILLMVVDHAFDWWLNDAGQATLLASITEFLGTLAAPLFLYLLGVGLALSAGRATQASRPRNTVVRYLLWRGGQLILWGYALNLLIFFVGDNPADLLAVDVLHTIGVCIWLTIPLLWLPTGVVITVALLIAALSQTAGGWSLPAWLAAYLTGTGGIGYFPLMLWLPYTYLGLVVGRGISRTTRPGRLMAGLVVLGLLAVVALPLVDSGWGYRHPRPVFVVFSIAVLFSTTAGFWLWIDHLRQNGPVVRALRDMGIASLMLYFLHHLVGFRLFWLLGWVTGRSWRGEYGVFSPGEASVLFVGLVGLMLAVTRYWLRRQGKMLAR